MRLLANTFSCHPWTEGKMKIYHKTGYDRLIIISQTLSGLVDSVVLVDDTVFPNFKEEINV
mgnify:CR=1 FL=1